MRLKTSSLLKRIMCPQTVKKQIENKSERNSRNKNRIKFVITSKKFSRCCLHEIKIKENKGKNWYNRQKK